VLNVNLAHAIQPGWERAFQSYWTFWLVLTIVTAIILWLSGLLLWSIWRYSDVTAVGLGNSA
jgi:heme/copper-type cytochrome/quinol oxidase subunit 2